MIAKKDSAVRVFRLKKKLVAEHLHEGINDIIKFAKEIPSSKILEFVRKEISEK